MNLKKNKKEKTEMVNELPEAINKTDVEKFVKKQNSGQELLEKTTYDYLVERWINEDDIDLHTLRITIHYMRKLIREHFNLDE